MWRHVYDIECSAHRVARASCYESSLIMLFVMFMFKEGTICHKGYEIVSERYIQY